MGAAQDEVSPGLLGKQLTFVASRSGALLQFVGKVEGLRGSQVYISLFFWYAICPSSHLFLHGVGTQGREIPMRKKVSERAR